MTQQVNITILVDVIGALSDKTLLNGNLAMMDNSVDSTGQGTPELSTTCRPGQTIQWTVIAVDLQTPVEIKSITFLGADPDVSPPPLDASSGDSVKLGLNVWSGIVPPYVTPGTSYRYELRLQMYEGMHSVMSIDSCSLRC